MDTSHPSSAASRRHAAATRDGLTLVELLVVLAIVAVLIAFVMPALAKVRQVAGSVACLVNLRSIGQGMLTYAAENRGAILGSPVNTTRGLWQDRGATGYALAGGVNVNNVPGPIELFDFIYPLCRVMRIELVQSGKAETKFYDYRTLKQFQCPAAEGIDASAAGYTSGRMLSYVTAATFLFTPPRTDNINYNGRVAMSDGNYWTIPPQYAPRVEKVGDGSRKVYAADGARFTRYDSAPTFNIAVTVEVGASIGASPPASMFTDYGPFWNNTKSYDRSCPNQVFPNPRPMTYDARVYSYRHGTRKPFERTGRYRLNAVFYDGHAETLEEMTACNPDLWLPRGTKVTNVTSGNIIFNAGGIWPDVVARYLVGAGLANPHIVP